MSDPLRDRVVSAIGDIYDIEGEIGRGGMSVVFRARDQRLNRRVAIKVLPPELAYDPAIRTRFTREAQTSAQLAHAHIVPIFDVGDRDGIAYLVMSLVAGGNLADLLARQPRQPVEEVRRLLAEVADALAYAHLRGVIHRDIKPDNILLDGETGRALVTDFGIARAIEAGTRLTLTGIAVGTPTYMSPEQAVGEREVDGRSDIYSLGVLGYQMLTGRVPFTAGTSMALLMKHMGEPPTPIAQLRSETPQALREVIERALMKAPEDRWPTAQSMRDALLSEGVPGTPWRPERRDPVRYSSPRPDGARRDRARSDSGRDVPGAVRKADGAGDSPAPLTAREAIVMEQAHLVPLTPEQRFDLRLWHGRVNLMDRIKAMRGYAVSTLVMTVAGVGAAIAGIAEGVPPLVLAPIVPGYMGLKLWRRGKSLRASGLRLRRVLLMPRAKWVLPPPPTVPKDPQLAKLATREVLESPQGEAIRRAAQERAAILDIVATLSKADRALLPELKTTVDALVERVAHLAQAVHRLDQSVDPKLIEELDARIAAAGSGAGSPEAERRLELMRRQRDTLAELAHRRVSLGRQIESAALALGNLRLDLIKFRSSGLQSALSDVSSATQQAQALSRDIGMALQAAAELKNL